MFSEGILKHTSMTAYLPVVGIAGGLAFCRGRRSHPFTYILKVCVACAFVPILNSLFYAPQFQLLRPVVLHAGAGAVRGHGVAAGTAPPGPAGTAPRLGFNAGRYSLGGGVRPGALYR